MKEKENKYGLLKTILVFVAIAMVLTWIIPSGLFSSNDTSSKVMMK